MKHLRLASLCALFVAPLAAHALTFNFTVVVTGGTPDGPAPWGTLTISDSGVNTVDFTLTNTSPVTSSQFFSELDLNITPYPSSFTSFSVISDPDLLLVGMSMAQDGINGIAGEKFDFEVDFRKSGSGQRFTSGKSVSWQLVATGLDASDFDSYSTGGNLPMKAMLHIQSLRDGTSSKVTPDGVPEPATMAILGLGLFGLARRRR
ncbi:MAG: PEP-CTERM sorting domain-containing protein [Armatimonadetes bacterium]|nr:PEP-CTERM sorting domain-containing protein [Armatimonadota bacterium]